MRLIGICVALAVGVFCFPAFGARQEGEFDCTAPQTTLDMNNCSYREWQKADKDLNVVYKKLVDALKAESKTSGDEAGSAHYFGMLENLKLPSVTG